jgi:vitellogenic carboxypeptidase-like protein
MSNTTTLQDDRRNLEGIQFSGYASVSDATDEELFYWFVGTEDYVNRPTILWTNGGPGSSSFWGFFLENGPYIVGPGSEYPEIDAGVVTTRAEGWNN